MDNGVAKKDAVNPLDALLADVVKKYEASEESTVDARAQAEKCRDYYDGFQTWDAKEESILRKRKQPIIRNNRIKPKIDFLLGMEIKNRVDPKAFPRTPQHEQDATAATDALRFVLDQNNFKKTKSAVWENLLIEGEGAVDIFVKPKKQGSLVSGYDIKIKRIPWDRMFVDPHSRAKDRSDAAYLGQVVWMDFDAATGKWPDAKLIFETTATNERRDDDTYGDRPRIRWTDPSRKRVRLVDMWYLRDGEWWHCIFTRSGFVEEPKKSPYIDENGNTEHGVVFQAAFLDRDGNAYSATKSWLDPQDEINKRRSKALHLLNVRQARVDKGAVADVKKDIAEQLAKPDGVIETNPGTSARPFEILPTGDMAQGQFQLLQEAKVELDAVGVNAALAGQDQRVMSGRALLARQESGMAELGPNFEALRDFEERVYRKVWNRIRQFWTNEMWVRVTDDERNVRFTGINRMMPKWQVTVEQAQEQGQQIPPEMLAQMQMDPAMQEKVKVNDVAQLDVDIILSEVPDTVSLQAEQFESLAKLAQAGMPIPPDIIIEASSLRDKEKILDKLRGKDAQGVIPPQVAQMIQQAQAELQAAQEDLVKREQALQKEKIGLLQKQAQYVTEELDVRRTEAQAEVITAQQKAEAEKAKAQAEVMSAQAEAMQAQGAMKLEGMLSQILKRLEALEGCGTMMMPQSKVKTIQITTPAGQTYTGQIMQ